MCRRLHKVQQGALWHRVQLHEPLLLLQLLCTLLDPCMTAVEAGETLLTHQHLGGGCALGLWQKPPPPRSLAA